MTQKPTHNLETAKQAIFHYAEISRIQTVIDAIEEKNDPSGIHFAMANLELPESARGLRIQYCPKKFVALLCDEMLRHSDQLEKLGYKGINNAKSGPTKK